MPILSLLYTDFQLFTLRAPPPHKNALLYVHFRGGARFVIPLFSIFYTHKWAKVHPPLKNSHEKNIQNMKETIFSVHFVFSVFKYTLPSQVRFKSVPSPFQRMGVTWDLLGNCEVIELFHILIYEEKRHYSKGILHKCGEFFVTLHSQIKNGYRSMSDIPYLLRARCFTRCTRKSETCASL